VIFIFNNYFIKEFYSEDEFFDYNSKIPLFIKKLAIKFFRFTNLMIIKENIIILPYPKNGLNKISDRKFEKFFKKIHKFLDKEGVQTIAISNNINDLENIESFKNLFYSNNYKILNGRDLFKNLSLEILEYISKETKKSINEMEVSILTNETSEFIRENIKLLSQNIKNLNIVTRNIEYFKPITQELYNSFGISVRISNNKKKILTNSNVIFNFDYPEETLNKFALPLNGIIINYNNKIKIRNKLFNGLNINYYTINVHKELIDNFKIDYLLNSFNLEILYESLYLNEPSFTKKLSRFIEDKVTITSLQGNNGKISTKEFSKLSKFCKNTWQIWTFGLIYMKYLLDRGLLP